MEQMGIGDNYQRAVKLLNLKSALTDVPAEAFQANGKTGFSARYFNNKTVNGNVVATDVRMPLFAIRMTLRTTRSKWPAPRILALACSSKPSMLI